VKSEAGPPQAKILEPFISKGLSMPQKLDTSGLSLEVIPGKTVLKERKEK
jgi:hypothetical protein